ncbi:hypothetical protein ACJJTC_010294, partial [Scirpophaga incertulas]
FFFLAFPTDPVIRKTDPGLRYQYVEGPDGALHLVDMWMKVSDLSEQARYNPDDHNNFHLFTRQNPTVSQPMVATSNGLLGVTNFNPRRRTIILLHGWMDSVAGEFNSALVPAFLQAEDVNVIVVDWNSGSGTVNYVTAVTNTLVSGESVGRFINWLNSVTGATPAQYHIAGHSLGGHQAGIIGRNVQGTIAYITALDPALPGWITNANRFSANDGGYTEVVHTNAGLLGYVLPLGHVDFYPNGGINMPGCNSQECDHSRCYYYFAESLLRGGFRGRACLSYLTAMSGNCLLPGSLRMGGLVPKTGATGIYYLETNAAPPYSRG